MPIRDGVVLRVDFADEIFCNIVLEPVGRDGRGIRIPGITRIGHDNQERQIPSVVLEPGSRVPIQVVSVQPVQQIENREPPALFVVAGQEDTITNITVE
jgi:hypothetical protein